MFFGGRAPSPARDAFVPLVF